MADLFFSNDGYDPFATFTFNLVRARWGVGLPAKAVWERTVGRRADVQ